MKRLTLQLSPQETEAFQALNRIPFHHRPEAIWAFWRKIAEAYGLRADSLISEGTRVTGLPVDSDKHWCWPFPLKCEKRPNYRDH